MAEGQKAAEETKGFFKDLNGASEGLRKNVNSFFDSLGGDKPSSGTSTSGIGNTSTSTEPSTTTGSGDVHPDAKRAGAGIQKGVDSAGSKLDEMMNRK